jgi:membrane-associated phospholipid phosphatase
MDGFDCGRCFDVFSNADTRLLLSLNSVYSTNDVTEKIFDAMCDNPLVRGFPVFFFIAMVWFSTPSDERRGRMLAGLFATFLSVPLSVWLQFHLSVHTRPFLNPALHLNLPDANGIKHWGHLGSFPSDTATLFFSLSTIIFLENRIAGGVSFLWSLITVGVVRIGLGWHYPSDIAGGMILGPALVYLFTRLPFITSFFERVLRLFEPRLYIIHALLFIYLADAYSLFPGLQSLVHYIAVIGNDLIG